MWQSENQHFLCGTSDLTRKIINVNEAEHTERTSMSSKQDCQKSLTTAHKYKTFRIAKSLSNMKQSHAFSGVQMANDMAQLSAENKV